MKKLAVILTVAMATLMAVTMASARGWGAIHGNYEMVATGNCLHDGSPFDPDPLASGFIFNGEGTLEDPYTATPKSADHFISTFMGEGTWTFHRDGTGMMQVMQYCILPDHVKKTDPNKGSTVPAQVTQSLMPSAPVPPFLLVDENKVPFEYEVDGSTIRVVIGPPVGLTLVGKISRDHKTMTLQSAMPVPPQKTQFNGVIGYWQVCNVARILIRMSEQDDD